MTAKFPEVDYQSWRTRLESELKNQTWDGIQWQVEEGLTLEPYYDNQNVPDLNYLEVFHQEWKKEKEPSKPGILALDKGLSAEEIKIAEKYGIKGWVSLTENTSPVYSLPYFSRFDKLATGFERDPFFEKIHGLFDSTGSVSNAHSVFIHGADIHQAGGNSIEELATVLVAMAYCVEKGIPLYQSGPLTITLSTGVQFWLDLCKLRAMRLLWMNFNHIHGFSGKLNLRTETSLRFWSKSDSDLNLLRNSIGVVSALLGGADEVLIYPHQIRSGKALEACRLAADIGHLATEESHLNQYVDPAAGSYQADTLTHHLASEAWKKFQEWTSSGIDQCLEEEVIQTQVLASANKLRKKFEDGKISMVGVNIFKSDFAQASDPFPMIWPEEKSLLKTVFLDA